MNDSGGEVLALLMLPRPIAAAVMAHWPEGIRREVRDALIVRAARDYTGARSAVAKDMAAAMARDDVAGELALVVLLHRGPMSWQTIDRALETNFA